MPTVACRVAQPHSFTLQPHSSYTLSLSLRQSAFSSSPPSAATWQEADELVEALTLRMSDYLLYVVDDCTSVDQRAIHRLSRRLASRAAAAARPAFSELIVVHNLRHVAGDRTPDRRSLSCLAHVARPIVGGAATSRTAADLSTCGARSCSTCTQTARRCRASSPT
jgi:hypothetical protein